VGVATFWRLVQEHGSAEAALEALPGVAAAAGIADYAPFPLADAERELSRGTRAGARLVAFGQPGYPAGLATIPDPPPILWTRGDLSLGQRPAIAIVGARNASSLGLRMARGLARGLSGAEGDGATGVRLAAPDAHVIVSGLARGIDAAAHEAALAGGTIAVMAGGIDVIYPPENAELAARIAAEGLLIAEQPPGLEPQARHFPQRNRLVAGLSRAVVVVEAAPQSGSLITARMALEQGREVLAVPGHPFDGRAGGCNQLIRDGATLVRGPADVLAALGPAMDVQGIADRGSADADHHAPARAARPEPPDPDDAAGDGRAPPTATVVALPQPGERPSRQAPAAAASADTRTLAETARLHRQILDRLGPSPLPEDQLIRDLARPVADIAADLLALELDGRITRQAGGLLSRTG
jgi:DNA processing protein